MSAQTTETDDADDAIANMSEDERREVLKALLEASLPSRVASLVRALDRQVEPASDLRPYAYGLLACYAVMPLMVTDPPGESDPELRKFLESLLQITYGHLRPAYHTSEAVHGCRRLEQKQEEEGWFFTAEFTPYSFGVSTNQLKLTLGSVFGPLGSMTYSLVRAMEGERDESYTPPLTHEDFMAVIKLVAASGFGGSLALEAAHSNSPPFGGAGNGESHLPKVLPELVKFAESFEGSLSTALDENALSAAAGELGRVLVSELAVFLATAQLCEPLNLFTDEPEIVEAGAELAEVLVRAAAAPGLLPRRALAAESASYVFNRLALGAPNTGLSERYFSAALASARIAYECSGHARRAKYLAQNLLEIAHLREDAYLVDIAEILWLDFYIMPHLWPLAFSPKDFAALGWTRVAASPEFEYEDIPSYQDAPEFIYSGPIAEDLLGAFQGSTSDLYAGVVLLVQRFKDLGLTVPELTSAERELPVVDLTAPEGSQVPMRALHPVAWLYYLATELFKAHTSGQIDAGLGITMPQVPLQAPYLSELMDAALARLQVRAPAPARHPFKAPMLYQLLLCTMAGEREQDEAAQTRLEAWEGVSVWNVEYP